MEPFADGDRLTTSSMNELVEGKNLRRFTPEGFRSPRSYGTSNQVRDDWFRVEVLNKSGADIDRNGIFTITKDTSEVEAHGTVFPRIAALNFKGGFAYWRAEDKIESGKWGWAQFIGSEYPVKLKYTGTVPKVGHPVGPVNATATVEYGRPGFVCIHPPDATESEVWCVRGFDHSLYGIAAAQIGSGSTGQITIKDEGDANLIDPETGSAPWNLPVVNLTNQIIANGCYSQAHPMLGVGWAIWPARMGTGVVQSVDWDNEDCILTQDREPNALFFICSANPVQDEIFEADTIDVMDGGLGYSNCNITWNTKQICVLKNEATPVPGSISGSSISVVRNVDFDNAGANCKLTEQLTSFCVLGVESPGAVTDLLVFTERDVIEDVYEDDAAVPPGLYKDKGSHYVPCFDSPTKTLVVEYSDCPDPTSEALYNVIPFSGSGTQSAGNLDAIHYDPTSGGTIELEATPIDGAIVVIKNVTTNTTNITVDGNGNDVQNHSSGAYASTQTVGDANITVTYQFNDADSQWEIIAGTL